MNEVAKRVALVLIACAAPPGCIGAEDSTETDEGTDLAISEVQIASNGARCTSFDHEVSQRRVPWCLTRCDRDPSRRRYVIGPSGTVIPYGWCNRVAEWFCSGSGLGHATNTCWGRR